MLSIVTPTYNRVHTLKDTLASVAGQTFKDIEHILVDNMSNDGTEALLREYQERAPYPVRYLREPDHGMYEAVNKGLKQATAEWTHILNSDDCYAAPTSLSTVFDRDLADYDLIANAIEIVNLPGEQKKLLWIPEYRTDISHFFFPHPGIILRRSFYEHHGYYDDRFKIVSDAIYGAQHYDKARRLIDRHHVLVRMDYGGISQQASLRNLSETLICTLWYHRLPLRVKLSFARQHLRDFMRTRLRRLGRECC